MASKAFKANNNKIVNDGDDGVNKTVINLSNKSKNNKSKKLIYMLNIEAIRKSTFLNLNGKKVFNYLRQIFIKTPIY